MDAVPDSVIGKDRLAVFFGFKTLKFLVVDHRRGPSRYIQRSDMPMGTAQKVPAKA
jgi:hypothetical protein